jgi:prepilin-type processing-associated H-X9-DG protein/prepilin-type N-terminal cleavage/methylation domain-containing protein
MTSRRNSVFARECHRTDGFTLIELTAVIAIAVVIVSLLVPTLSVAKKHAMSAKCQNNLRQLGTAVLSYVADNDGYFPVSGSIWANPPETSWDVKLLPYMGITTSNRPLDLLRCPADTRVAVVSGSTTQYPRSYSMSGIRTGFLTGDGVVSGTNSRRQTQLSHPSRTVLLIENFTLSSGSYIVNYQFGYNWSFISGWLGGDSQAPRLSNGKFYHGALMNFCFADGHVESLPPASANTPSSLWTAVEQ